MYAFTVLGQLPSIVSAVKKVLLAAFRGDMALLAAPVMLYRRLAKECSMYCLYSLFSPTILFAWLLILSRSLCYLKDLNSLEDLKTMSFSWHRVSRKEGTVEVGV